MALEGLGGPVTMDEYHLEGIDPALEDCCQREVQSNRRYNALTSTLRRHDVSLLADRRRRNLIKVRFVLTCIDWTQLNYGRQCCVLSHCTFSNHFRSLALPPLYITDTGI